MRADLPSIPLDDGRLDTRSYLQTTANAETLFGLTNTVKPQKPRIYLAKKPPSRLLISEILFFWP